MNNTARSYQDLIDEVEQEQAKMLEELKYVLTGIIAGRKFQNKNLNASMKGLYTRNLLQT